MLSMSQKQTTEDLASVVPQNLEQHQQPYVAAMGLCCMDYLAQAASYPKADAKLRTEKLEVRAQAAKASFWLLASLFSGPLGLTYDN